MAGSLTPPGVQIKQSITTTSPTIRIPTLKACIIGPCIQLIDAADDSGSINTEAYAGTYNGDAKNFAYPSIETYASPLTWTVKVYFRYGNSASLTELDSDEFVASSLSVMVTGGAQGIDPVDRITVRVYIQYQALRKDIAPYDLSNLNGTKTGIEIETTDDITTYLGDIDSRNPLALAAYIAKLNAPFTSIMCIGVDDVAATMLEGTTEAYQRALEFCETLEVYTLVPLTQETSVLSLFPTHVTAMSSLTGKKERICFLNVEMPDTSADETQASGSYGQILSITAFETAAGDISDVSVGDKLVIANETTEWTVSGIFGTTVTVDPHTLPVDALDHVWSIYTPGTPLTTRASIAAAYALIGESYANRRVFLLVPDIVEMTLDGIDQELPGYYGCAAVAGQVGDIQPQLPHTNLPISGLIGLDGSNDFFTPTNLNEMAGGGLYILAQDGQGTLIYCRHQLSTDISSIETRELSITKQIDYYAKTLRTALTPYIGRNVITQRYIDYRLVPTIGGISDYLADAGVIGKAEITEIKQSDTAPDTATVTIDLTVLYPLNYITITLEI